ncbi:hypothetical protein EJB05_42127, partial [Eragrostis curvula]
MRPKCLVLAVLFIVAATVSLMLRGAKAGTRASTDVLISGIVPCSIGSAIDVAEAPVFPDAGLQLECGGKTVADATTNGTGAFLINLGSVGTDLLTVLLENQCKVVVITPLAACNVSLAVATGMLTAPLQLMGNGDVGRILGQIIGGLVGGILNLVPQPFSLV